jgi:hypothetical protein
MLLWCHEAPLPGRERPFVVVCLCLVRWFGKGKHYRSSAVIPVSTANTTRATTTRILVVLCGRFDRGSIGGFMVLVASF